MLREAFYRVSMELTLEVRRAQFADYWKRELERAEAAGMSVPKIAKAAGVGSNTIYRWRDGNWSEGPKPGQIVSVCDVLDIDPAEPMSILWSGKRGRRPEPTRPSQLPRDVEAILRRLEDPETPEPEKYLIREMLRSLAVRPGKPDSQAG